MKINKDIILSYLNSTSYRRTNINQMAKKLHVTSEEYLFFNDLLKQLQDELLVIELDGFYYPRDVIELATVIAKKNGKYVVSCEGKTHLVSASTRLNLLYKDIVVLSGRNEKKIIKIVKRQLTTFVATVNDEGISVTPNNPAIGEKFKFHFDETLEAGEQVEVSYINAQECQIVRRLKDHQLSTDILNVLIDEQIRFEFNEDVIEQSSTFPEEIDVKDIVGRLDLRQELIYTIDGADAKDLDDAISVVAFNGGYRVIIAIADVSHYVRRGSPIDREASARGTSLYLLDKVVPMLPTSLSNGLCSLHAGVDRLTMALIVDLDSRGVVMNYQIEQAVINSKYRLTYEAVNRFFHNEHQFDPLLSTSLKAAHQLFVILSRRRTNRGSLDLVSPESKIKTDHDGNIASIERRFQDDAEKVIEELMILANEIVATHIYQQGMPFIYRVHDLPSKEKSMSLKALLRALRYRINKIDNFELQKLLRFYKGKEEEMVINTVVLRSLAKAKYDIKNIGHFGLASECYTHFTSPIRRYPDLIVHRLLKEYLFTNKRAHYQQQLMMLDAIAVSCSDAERKAISAERKIEDIAKAKYLERFIGQEFDGRISGVTSFGVFVELENTCQGLIRYGQLEDYYYFDENRMCAVGERSKQVFSIGKKVKIAVGEVDIIKGAVDFSFIKFLQ